MRESGDDLFDCLGIFRLTKALEEYSKAFSFKNSE